MANDDPIATYGAAKRLTDAMEAREKFLDGQTAKLNAAIGVLLERTAALHAVIAELKQLPSALGQQTSQYIAAGVRESIKEDFSWPIAQAVNGPVAALHRAAQEARTAIQDIKSQSKIQNWTAVAILVLLSIAVGMTGSYVFYKRDVAQINDRLDSIQQQITPPPAPVTDVKPEGKPAKGKKGH